MIIYGTIMSNGICRDNVDLQGDSGGSKGKPLSNCREIVLKSANFDVYCTRSVSASGDVRCDSFAMVVSSNMDSGNADEPSGHWGLSLIHI